MQFVIEDTTLSVEDAGIAYGATIVAVACTDQAHYERLPYTIKCNGVACHKVSYHDHIGRAFYRSDLMSVSLSVPPEHTPDDLFHLSNQELVEMGYLVIRQQGVMKSYYPTDKWRSKMKMVELPTTIHDQYGTKTFQASQVKGLLAAYVAEGE